jgi:para-nitrobenzyl esterase
MSSAGVGDVNSVEEILGTVPSQDLADTVHADWVRFVTAGTCPWPTVADHPAGA